MFFSTLTFLMCLFAAANAHFRLLYPLPRGEFVADNEPNFCGGYTDVTTNRTTFPLSGGFFSIKTGHSPFTVGTIISTVANPNNFDNFSVNGVQQIVGPYDTVAEAGTLCFPLNISAAGIEGVSDGANVTIQIVVSGGDGNLYQCADLTLKENLTIASDVSCSNETATTTATSPTSTSTSTTTSGGSSLAQQASAATAVIFGMFGVVAAFL